MATAAGAMLAIAPLPTFLGAIAWMAALMRWHRASVASLVAAVAVPALLLLFQPSALWVALLLAGGVAWRHKENIARLRVGTEF